MSACNARHHDNAIQFNSTEVAADRAWEAVQASESGYDKERSLCGQCKKRFASVSCEECRRGYCLRWASIVVVTYFLCPISKLLYDYTDP